MQVWFTACEFGKKKWVALKEKERPNVDMFANADKLIKLYVLIEHISPSKTSSVRECIETHAHTLARVSIYSVCVERYVSAFLVFADKEIENELRLYFSIYLL